MIVMTPIFGYTAEQAVPILVERQQRRPLADILKNQVSIEKAAEQLIKDSYISLDMQYAAVASLEEPIIMNKKTGKIRNIPSVENIIHTYTTSIQQKNQAAEQRSILAIQAAYQAVQTALFIAATEQLYNEGYKFIEPGSNAPMMKALLVKKQALQEIISPQDRSWSDFIWQNITTLITPTQKQQFRPFNNSIDLADDDELAINAMEVQELLENTDVNQAHDYKKLYYNPAKQADLLFEQCLIGQQHHRAFNAWQNLNITAPYYHPKERITVNKIIENVQAIADEKNPDLAAVHQLLLDTRLALQTALDVATRRTTYIFSAIYIRDPLILELQRLDALIEELIENENYGATSYDRMINPYRDYLTLAITRGPYIAGALLTIFTSTYLTYHHGGKVMNATKLVGQYNIAALNQVLSLFGITSTKVYTKNWLSFSDWLNYLSGSAISQQMENQEEQTIPTTPEQPPVAEQTVPSPAVKTKKGSKKSSKKNKVPHQASMPEIIPNKVITNLFQASKDLSDQLPTEKM